MGQKSRETFYLFMGHSVKLKAFIYEGSKKKMGDNTIAIVNDMLLNLKQRYVLENPEAEFLKISARQHPKDPTVIEVLWGQYIHDCQKCLYLGTYKATKWWLGTEDPHFFDRYRCSSSKSLILRYGDEPESYESLPEDVVIDIIKNGTMAEEYKIVRFVRAYEAYLRHCPPPSKPTKGISVKIDIDF